MNLEKITNFMLALGSVLTACTGIYREYNKTRPTTTMDAVMKPEDMIKENTKSSTTN